MVIAHVPQLGPQGPRQTMEEAFQASMSRGSNPERFIAESAGWVDQWIEDNKGAQQMLDHFAKVEEEEITQEMVRVYIDSTDTPLTIRLREDLKKLESANSQERIDAESTLLMVTLIMRERQKILQKTRSDLNDIKENNPGLIGNHIEKPISFAYDGMKKFAVGFMDAPLGEKAIMVGGVAAGYLAIKTLIKLLPGGEGKWKEAKKWTGVALGGTATVFAIEAMNRASERAWGRPLLSSAGGIFTGTTPENYRLNRDLQILNESYGNLSDIPMPQGFLDEILEGKSKYALGIANIAGMKVEELRTLYEKNRTTRTIEEDDELYPLSVDGSDRLSAIERFALAEDIAGTLELLDADKNFTIPKEKENARVFYLAMQYEKK